MTFFSKIFFLLLLLQVDISFGQKEGNIWYWGGSITNSLAPGAGLDFNSGSPVAITNSTMGLTEGSAVQSNRQGSLLFYTNGETVFDRTHSIMLNGTVIGGNKSSVQSAVIIPFDNDTNKFYVFANSGYPTATGLGLFYSIVDMNLNGGLGGITAPKKIPIQAETSELLSATKHSNGIDFWVVTTDFDSLIFNAYKVNSFGISPPVKSNMGFYCSSYFKLDFNTKGDMLTFKINVSASNMKIRTIANFNQTTGIVSNFIQLDSLGYGDAAYFSPNDKILYSFTFPTLTSQYALVQYDLTASNIYTSQQIVKYPYTYHQDMKLGPDNKIYVNGYNLDTIDVIHNPDVWGIGCNYQEKAVPLGGKKSYAYLPNKTFPLANILGTGLNKHQIDNEIMIYPNPTENILSISYDANIGWDKIEIINYLSETVLKSKFQNELDTSELPNGIYILQLKNSQGQVAVKRLVVSK